MIPYLTLLVITFRKSVIVAGAVLTVEFGTFEGSIGFGIAHQFNGYKLEYTGLKKTRHLIKDKTNK